MIPKAPKSDCEILLCPNRGSGIDFLEENQEKLRASNFTFLGMKLSVLRDAFRSKNQLESTQPIFASGHQPEWFHPGVWVKNAFSHALAKKHDGQGVHVIVDHDICKSASIAVPTNADSSQPIRQIAFAQLDSPRPYEEAFSSNASAMLDFIEQVKIQSTGWKWQPLLDVVETFGVSLQRDQPQLPWHIAFSELRNLIETHWGIDNRDFLMSEICNQIEFIAFASEFLFHADRFREIHNRHLEQYRVEHRIRSKNHPVADLQTTEEGIETPFWIWQHGRTQRGRLYVHIASDEWKFFWNTDRRYEIRISSADKEIAPLRLLKELRANHYRLRPRALMNSLYLKLIVSDVFIHGIGGAVYDELGDRIFSEYFQTEMPRFLIATATLRLPWDPPLVDPTDEFRRLKTQLRRMQFEPELFLDAPDERKVEIDRIKLESPHSYEERRSRHQKLMAHRVTISAEIEPLRETCRAQLKQTTEFAGRYRQLQNREFAWCLHPENRLRMLMERAKDHVMRHHGQ